jgi:preprotein translocase subunit SecD
VKVVESRTVGPTLGSESIRKVLPPDHRAHCCGSLYGATTGCRGYVALIIYALITLMLYKLIPVVITMPGLAGFILSIGMAVDANVLIFERLKEELRAGRSLQQAIDLGWRRAWPSIRDSNISSLITCAILFILAHLQG